MCKVEHFVVTGIESKQCKQCKEIKCLTEFGKDKYTSDGHFNICLECKRIEYQKRKNNPEFMKKHRIALKKFRNNNREKVRLKDRESKKIKYQDASFKKNESERKHIYSLKNKDKIKNYNEKYYAENTEKVKDISKKAAHTRRARIKNAPATLTKKDWEDSKSFFNSSCAYCGKKILRFHQEHVIPVSKGGGYVRQNIIPACKECNLSKHTNNMEKWYKEQTFFSEERLLKIYKWINAKQKGDLTIQQMST